jgi:hypothetical protein
MPRRPTTKRSRKYLVSQTQVFVVEDARRQQRAVVDGAAVVSVCSRARTSSAAAYKTSIAPIVEGRITKGTPDR